MGSGGCTTPNPVARSRAQPHHRDNVSYHNNHRCRTQEETASCPSNQLFVRPTTSNAAAKRFNIMTVKKRKYDSRWTTAMTLYAAIALGACFIAVSFLYVVTIIGRTTQQHIPRIPSERHQQQLVEPPWTISHSNTHTNLRRSTTNGNVNHATVVEFNDSSKTRDYNYDVPVSWYNSTTVRFPDPVLVPFPNHQFIVLVMSHRSHDQRRTVIRQTWGRTYAKSLLFVIGGPFISAPEVQEERLLREQRMHRDLLNAVHPECYRSLPHKLRFAIHWVTAQMQHEQSTSSMLRWILKVDDDMYLRDIHHFAPRSVPPINVPVVMGCIQHNVAVQRSGKWAEDAWFYERYPIYPPWPKGSCGYVFNRIVANIVTEKYNQDIRMMMIPQQEQLTSRTTPSHMENVSDESINHSIGISHGDPQFLFLPSYQGEDTSFGIWLQHSNVTWIDSPFFVNNGNCDIVPRPIDHTSDHGTKQLPPMGVAVHDAILPWSIGHRMTPDQMQHCYEMENVYVNHNNGTIPYYPFFEYDPQHQQQPFHHPNPSTPRDLVDINISALSAAYTVAMMHHVVDQQQLRRQQEMEERWLRRQKKIQQFLRNQ